MLSFPKVTGLDNEELLVSVTWPAFVKAPTGVLEAVEQGDGSISLAWNIASTESNPTQLVLSVLPG